MLSRTINASLLSILLLLPALSGCSSDKPAVTKEETADLSKVGNEPVALIFKSDFPDDQDVFNRYYGDRIKAKFPNVTINFLPRIQGQGIQDLLNAGLIRMSCTAS